MSGAADREALLKRIGISKKLFSRAQWTEAARVGQESGASPGEALVDQGVLSVDQLRGLERAVLYRMGRDEDKELAKIILDSGYAPREAVEAALERQKEVYSATGKLARLGDVLLEGRVLADPQIRAAKKILEIAKSSRRPSTREDDSNG